ncbi:lipopolysaccharide biosynthesis protein [Phycicoccus sp. Soil748]|uniref:lipopolysaccharide biosynthesis protein n=1 Tax=Phycicoccus sp. Soil748 TaxID=1736397 RepID=UPI0012E36948|nr:hypothetical protein [Phycicoccus sp. Soil748]
MAAFLILTRREDVPQVGRVVFAQAIAALVMIILDVRFEDAAQRYYPLIARSAKQEAQLFFWRIVRLDLMFGISVSVLSVALWLTSALPRTHVLDPEFLTLSLAAAGLGTATGTLRAGFAISDNLAHYSRVSFYASLATSALLVLGTVVAGARGYLSATVAGACVQLVWLWITCRGHLSPARHSPKNAQPPVPEGFYRFLFSTSASSSLALGSESGVLAMSGLLGGPALTAFLKVAQAPGRVAQTAFSPLSTQSFPRIAHAAASGDRDAITRLVQRMTITVLGVGLLGLLVLSPLMSRLIAIMYGHEYASVALPATIFAAGGLVRSAFSWTKVFAAAMGRPGVRLGAVAMEAVITLGCTSVLIVHFTDLKMRLAALATLNLTIAIGLAVFWKNAVSSASMFPVSPSRQESTRTPQAGGCANTRQGEVE